VSSPSSFRCLVRTSVRASGASACLRSMARDAAPRSWPPRQLASLVSVFAARRPAASHLQGRQRGSSSGAASALLGREASHIANCTVAACTAQYARTSDDDQAGRAANGPEEGGLRERGRQAGRLAWRSPRALIPPPVQSTCSGARRLAGSHRCYRRRRLLIVAIGRRKIVLSTRNTLDRHASRQTPAATPPYMYDNERRMQQSMLACHLR
jgi:hypothetical protein